MIEIKAYCGRCIDMQQGLELICVTSGSLLRQTAVVDWVTIAIQGKMVSAASLTLTSCSSHTLSSRQFRRKQNTRFIGAQEEVGVAAAVAELKYDGIRAHLHPHAAEPSDAQADPLQAPYVS